MTTINDLSIAATVGSDDKIPLWQNANGATRSLPVSLLDARYLKQSDISLLAISPATEIFSAGTDFTPGTTATLTLKNQYLSTANIEVFFDASFQGPDQYTLVGTVLAFTSAIPAGIQKVYVRGGTSRLTNGPSDGTVLDTSVASGTRLYRRITDVRSFNDFGAVGDNTADDTAAIASALAWVQAGVYSVGGPVRSIYQPAGYLFRTTAPLGVSIPCVIKCESHIFYYGTTGSAFIIGQNPPPNGLNRGYDISFSGIRHAVGWTVPPTGTNDAGASGLEIRNMQFSRVYCGELIAFTNNGFYGNSSNDNYSGQHCQDNDITLGQVAFCGRGFFSHSVSAATGAYQVNRTHIQNSFSNFKNVQCDTGVGLPSDNASSSNFFSGTIDAPAPGGTALEFNSQYSKFDFMFITGPVIFSSTSAFNRFNVANNFSTGVAMFDGGLENWLTTNPPDSGQLPASVPVPGAAQQNSFGVPVMAYVTATVTPNVGGETRVTVSIGKDAASLVEIFHHARAAGSDNAFALPISFMIPPMRYWQITTTGPGSVSFSNIRFLMAG